MSASHPHNRRYFHETFAEARCAYLKASDDIQSADKQTASYPHPFSGKDGEELATDVTIIGDADARHVLLVNSATHGVEGFYGSAVQCGWLERAQCTEVINNLPKDLKLVFVHAINPHGFSHIRRVNEDNVDPNRNFIDHGSDKPANPEYDLLHSYLRPDVFSEEAFTRADQKMQAIAKENGDFSHLNAILRGQYSRADGLFYGGTGRIWSNLTFREILRDQCAAAETIAFLDLHTGLGPYGYAELICNARETAAVDLLRSWHGRPLTQPATPASGSPRLSGNITRAVYDECPQACILPITVEIGTYDFETVLKAHRADNWLYFQGDPRSTLGDEIRAQIKEALCPEDKDWRDLVLFRSYQIIDRTIEGLSALPG